MTGGQVFAFICALLLLLPGGCFLLVGSVAGSSGGPFVLIGALILALAGLLFWAAFRRRPPDGPGGQPPRSE